MTRIIAAVLSSFLLTAIPGVAADECRTIYEVVCGSAGLESFCGLIGSTDTETLFDGDEELTVFAPINEAVTAMEFLQDLHEDKLREVVLFSTHVGALRKDELECYAGRNKMRMMSGKDSRTICEEKIPTFQKGGGNSDEKKPVILATDLEACNGVVHMVDTVMLPGGFEEESEGAGSEPSEANKASSGTQLCHSGWYYALALLTMYVGF